MKNHTNKRRHALWYLVLFGHNSAWWRRETTLSPVRTVWKECLLSLNPVAPQEGLTSGHTDAAQLSQGDITVVEQRNL